MTVDVFGGNCVGKTTLVQGLAEHEKITFTPLRESSHADGIRRLYDQSRALMANRVAAQTFFNILALGERKLAGRFRKHLSFQKTLLARAGPVDATVVTDEGVIKKMYEAVPFLDQASYERERLRWLRFNAAVGAQLFATLGDAIELFVYVFVDADTYVRRVRERGYMIDQVPEDRIVRRYALQSEVYADLLDRATAARFPVISLRSGENDALGTLVNEVRAHRRG
jgi:deoxyadenosine/deoxycytidine kinase